MAEVENKKTTTKKSAEKPAAKTTEKATTAKTTTKTTAKTASKPAAEKPAVKATAKPATEKAAAKTTTAKVTPKAETEKAATKTVAKAPKAKVVKGKAQTFQGTGRRKCSVARVRIVPGTGVITVNNEELKAYFNLDTLIAIVKQPLVLTETLNNVDVTANIYGGGKAGQAGALRHGITRALIEYRPELRSELKKAGLVTRDARRKERKKYGLHKARRAPQFSKR